MAKASDALSVRHTTESQQLGTANVSRSCRASRSRSARALGSALLCVIGLGFGCARGEHSEIHASGVQAQARPSRCGVEDFRYGGPPAGYLEVARVKVVCFGDGQADALTCERRLLDTVCQAGGYAMWTLTERRSRGRRTLSVAAGKPASLDAPLQVDFPACSPRCSEGFACDRGKCIAACQPTCEDGFRCVEGVCEPQCNPRCEGDAVCGSRRTCEMPTAGAEVEGAGDQTPSESGSDGSADSGAMIGSATEPATDGTATAGSSDATTEAPTPERAPPAAP